MFVLNPDPFLLPAYRISPFRTVDAENNAGLGIDHYAVDYFDNRFGKGTWTYTINGREAIGLALSTYNLKPNDVVTILTTSGNKYISSCVTKEIEQICKWNREITSETRVIFVNHEFGYPYPNIDKLKSFGLPIIEDCCTTFFSQDEDCRIGNVGDYVIYSFPKFFPIQIGGLLVSNKIEKFVGCGSINPSQKNHLQNVLSFNLRNESRILEKRRLNWSNAANQFSKLGFTPRFESKIEVIPSVLLLRNNGILKDLSAFKVFLNAHGIQNSIFYGEDAFFIPSHQNLSDWDMEYFFFCVQNYVKSQKH